MIAGAALLGFIAGFLVAGVGWAAYYKDESDKTRLSVQKFMRQLISGLNAIGSQADATTARKLSAMATAIKDIIDKS